MIDRIKLMAKDIDANFLLNNFQWEYKKIDDAPFKEGKQANLNNKSSRYGLRMLLSKNLNTKTYTLTIDGSIRKWYLNENDRRDLNFVQFEDCIELLGKKIGLKQGEVWKIFKVTALEVGVTLLLKSCFRNIMDCFVKYRNASRSDEFKTTIYFQFKNYDILLYDKFCEMKGNKIWTKKETNVFNKFHFLRFEISATKVSNTTFAKKFDTLELIKNNWSQLSIILNEYLNKMEFIDLISDENLNESKTISEINRQIKFSGMKSIGILNIIEAFKKIEQKNNKSKHLSELLNIYRSFISTDRDYKSELIFALKKKTDRLL
ncbi:hypothetical protein J2Y38_003826 [Flavobacterium sp. 2755]|uniref:hypothetical protein n=1 Tax=Flavobacterium sp. 2755 TaxID=2817765 RepID=UPI0028623FA6|nr:hypothetical protein [Flavobacterium sp. 2755]MDR6763605.1 hypothetical protein [Flavobacterium sp. 2755]